MKLEIVLSPELQQSINVLTRAIDKQAQLAEEAYQMVKLERAKDKLESDRAMDRIAVALASGPGKH